MWRREEFIEFIEFMEFLEFMEFVELDGERSYDTAKSEIRIPNKSKCPRPNDKGLQADSSQ